MAVVDYEIAWFALKARIAMKRSHSARELAETMAELEVENMLPEEQRGYDDRPLLSHERSLVPPDGEPDREALSAAS